MGFAQEYSKYYKICGNFFVFNSFGSVMNNMWISDKN